MTRVEKNKIIMEFMGVKPTKMGDHWQWSDSPFFTVHHDTEEKVIDSIAEYAKYDTSWDWLMPVIKRWREVINTKLTMTEYYIAKVYSPNPYDYTIEQCYNSLIGGIKFLNSIMEEE